MLFYFYELSHSILNYNPSKYICGHVVFALSLIRWRYRRTINAMVWVQYPVAEIVYYYLSCQKVR